MVDRTKVLGWATNKNGDTFDTSNPIVLPEDNGTARMVRVYNVLRDIKKVQLLAGHVEQVKPGVVVAVECSYPQHNVLVTIGGLQCVGQVEHGQIKPIVQAVGHDGGNWLMTLQAARHVGWVD